MKFEEKPMRLRKLLTALVLGAGTVTAAAAPLSPSYPPTALQVQAQRSPDRDACRPGTACWRRMQDRQDDYLAERQRSRQLRQFGIDNGRNMRSNGMPAYRDNEIKVFRPSDRLLVDPNRR